MNTTYDTKFRFRTMVQGIDTTLYQWQKSEPTLHTVANAIKMWQNDWNTLGSILNREGGNVAAKTHNIHMALEEAWENRDNRKMALKSLTDAKDMLRGFFNENEKAETSFVPLYRRRSIKSAFGVENYTPQAKRFNQYDSSIHVKSWIEEARQALDELNQTGVANRQYIAFNPHLEGSIYQRTALRVKSWIEDNYVAIEKDLKPASKQAVKGLIDSIERIQVSTPNGLLDDAQRRRIYANIRSAYKMLGNIEPEIRTPVIKADIFSSMNSVRNRVDNIMPVLEHGEYDESDFYREVTQTIDDVRNLAEAAPVKFMPPDTWENFQNVNRSLTQVLVNRNPSVKVKSLMAAAANLDVIARDMAGLDGFFLTPEQQQAYKSAAAVRQYDATNEVYADNPFLA